MLSTAEAEPRVMPCMEVWGGNRAVDCGVVMLGLDAWVFSRPHGGAAGGGDVYYVSSCATGRVTRLLVADVSGHGEAVADMGEYLRALMRRYVNYIDQDRFMSSLNARFGAMAAEGRFATSVVATFFSPTNKLTLSNAGHPPPLRYSVRGKRWSLLDRAEDRAANVPFGVVTEGSFDEHSIRLDVGDLVLFYTDSLIESPGPGGAMLGRSGLLDAAAGLDVDRPEALIPALLQRLGDPAADDVTALLIRPNGLAPRVPVSRRLAAPVRVAGGVLRALLLPGRGPSPWPEASVRSIGGAFFDRLNRDGRR